MAKGKGRCTIEIGGLKIHNVSEKAALRFGIEYLFALWLAKQIVRTHRLSSDRELLALIHAALEDYPRPCEPREAQRLLRLIN